MDTCIPFSVKIFTLLCCSGYVDIFYSDAMEEQQQHHHHHISLRLVGFLAFCLLTSYFDAACIDMACFQQLPCAIYTFCSQCSFRSGFFFYVFDVPANTMLSDKLFQLFITLLVKPHKNAF